MENQRHRPLGITIIAILAIIAGISSIAVGVPLLVVLIGIGFIILGIVYLAVAYGLWKGKKWAWTVTLIVSVISIIIGIASLATGNVGAIIQIIISAVIIYYLYRPNVKAYFGK
jgi:uncharacterized membrane protein HdeD (DUF308 family)